MTMLLTDFYMLLPSVFLALRNLCSTFAAEIDECLII